MKKKFIYKNTELSYSVFGKGKTVMLVHGFAEDGRIWDNLIEKFNGEYEFIIPDIPGSGGSSIIDKPEVGLEDYADCIHAIIKEEEAEDLTMIGHSMGGYIALAFTERFPALVNRLGLFHSSPFADDEAKIETRRKGIRFIKEHGSLAFLKTMIPSLFADQAISEEYITLLLSRANSFDPKALVQYYEAMIVRPDRSQVLKNFSKPVLIIAGKYDKAVPMDASLRQTIMPSLAYLHILRNTAHMGMLEETLESNRILGYFLENT